MSPDVKGSDFGNETESEAAAVGEGEAANGSDRVGDDDRAEDIAISEGPGSDRYDRYQGLR